MSSHSSESAEVQVHYLGSSADLVAVRRSLEARGIVSRSRLTPGVAAVVADRTVPLDHPTLVGARELGIEVFTPAEAVDRLLATRVRQHRQVPLPIINTPLLTVTVLVVIGLVTVLALIGALANNAPASQITTSVREASENR